MLLSIIIVALLVYWLYYEFIGKRKGLPPGPIPLPIMGNLLQFDPNNPEETLVNWSKKYGAVYSVWLPTYGIMVTDYEIMKESFIKQGDIYTGRPEMYIVNVFTGNTDHKGLMFSHGPLWHEQRRFTLHMLRDFGFGRNLMEQKITTEIDRLVNHIEGLLDESGKAVIKPKELLSICVGSIISCLVFGHPYEFGDQRFLYFKDLMTEFGAVFVDPKTMMLELWPWLSNVPLFGNFGMKKLADQELKFRKFFYEELDAHKSKFDPNAEPSDYFDAFFKEQHRRKEAGKEEGSYSDWQLYHAGFDLWSAGLETTVTTICWAILYLLHYPEVERKVSEEINTELGSDSSITMADKNRLTYTASTMNEIQRLANIIPLNIPHTTNQDCKLAGYDIKAGTTVTPIISIIHMDSKFFPDPEKFKPERFLEEDGKTAKKIEQLIPFSIGKRKCMGESLANMELFLIFTTIMQKFKFSVLAGQEKPSMKAIYGISRAPIDYEVAVEKR